MTEALDRDPRAKLELFEDALRAFLERVAEDRTILAVVRIGSLREDLMWKRDGLSLWIIEIDGVTRRLRSDGTDERVWRTFCEEGVNLHAEVIPRSRFKRMVEGNSRTAFTCNFFATRELVYCEDPSIETWFEDASRVATKDQEKELFSSIVVVIHAYRWVTRLFEIKKSDRRTASALDWAAHEVAGFEIVKHGEICEDDILARAKELEPDLFDVVHEQVTFRKATKKALRAAIDRIEAYLEEHAVARLEPLLHFLRKQKRVVPFSEICEHFAHTQLYPWHLEESCEWLERQGVIEKVAAPFRITKKSHVEVEEPAYFYDA